MKKTIGGVDIGSKEYKVDNLKQITDVITNVYVRDNGFFDGYGYENTLELIKRK